jgi:hypothetical protein
LRATLRNFGLKVGMVGTVKFEARIKELVENLPDLAVLVEPLLIVRRVVREQIGILTVTLTARSPKRLFHLVFESHDGSTKNFFSKTSFTQRLPLSGANRF